MTLRADATERGQNMLQRQWPVFANGNRFPAPCWAAPFVRSAGELVAPRGIAISGLVVVAIGGHPDNVAYAPDGNITPPDASELINHATNGIVKLAPSPALWEAYSGLSRQPGVGSLLDVLVIAKAAEKIDDSSMTHLGARDMTEIAPQLGWLTTSLAQESQA